MLLEFLAGESWRALGKALQRLGETTQATIARVGVRKLANANRNAQALQWLMRRVGAVYDPNVKTEMKRHSVLLYARRYGPGGGIKYRLSWVGKWPTTCWSRTSPPALGHKRCVIAELIARRLSCSDFQLASQVSHSRIERALPN